MPTGSCLDLFCINLSQHNYSKHITLSQIGLIFTNGLVILELTFINFQGKKKEISSVLDRKKKSFFSMKDIAGIKSMGSAGVIYSSVWTLYTKCIKARKPIFFPSVSCTLTFFWMCSQCFFTLL